MRQRMTAAPQSVEEAMERVAEAIADLTTLQVEAAIAAAMSDQVEAAQATDEQPRGADRIWFSTAQAAGRAGRHPATVRDALEAGVLHGSQKAAEAHWRIHATCLDAWIAGQSCAHQEGGGGSTSR